MNILFSISSVCWILAGKQLNKLGPTSAATQAAKQRSRRHV